MKKNYIQPNIKCMILEEENLMAASFNASTTGKETIKVEETETAEASGAKGNTWNTTSEWN